ncbi:MAG TPA: hypothetical protein VH414_04910 [Lichenihabitans sp.]|nr:hypothetical protein [Lichenihabitans sp.]
MSYVLMPDLLAKVIDRLSEIHVYDLIDNRSDVYITIYTSTETTPMNRLSLDRRTQAIGCLVEGNSIRSVERMTGIHRDTIMRLLVEVGTGCEAIMDAEMRDLPCQRLQIDEIWTYVGKKQRQVRKEDDQSRVGDQWTFVAMDADTKLIPAYRVGKRDLPTAKAFMGDLSERLANRVQLSSDALAAYVEATEEAFGADVDYGQVVKFYEAEPIGPGRYSPPRVVRAERKPLQGSPDPKHISTSLIERQNLTMRMSMRRFTRLTNAFSKKVENLQAAVAVHFAHYNFVRIHSKHRVTPAMAAGVSDRLWSLHDLVERTSV